ncbi:hypothetical protein PENTCL1PPCAC_18664, partial [Pristionchus entomophagus]
LQQTTGMSRYRCCCCSVTVGSRIWASLAIIGACLAMISNFWSAGYWYFWTLDAFLIFYAAIPAIFVFMAVKRRRPGLMIPIMVTTAISQLGELVYLGFAIVAIFVPNSPLAKGIINVYGPYIDWSQISYDDFTEWFSIGLSIGLFIANLLTLWMFITHYQTFKSIKEELIHCLHHDAPQVHVIPTSYPAPSAYPSPVYTNQAAPAYPSAQPAQNPVYPNLNPGYGYDPAVGRAEQVRF